MTEKLYLIIKRGLFYRPNSAGYTGVKDEAGRYTLDETAVRFPNESESGLSYIHEDDAPEYSPACFYDIKLRHQLKKKTALVDIYKGALEDIVDKSDRESEASFTARTALDVVNVTVVI